VGGHPFGDSAQLPSAQYPDRMPNPDTPVLLLVFTIALWLLVVVVSLLILWAIIRGAVLSALRKHHDETQRAAATAGYRQQ